MLSIPHPSQLHVVYTLTCQANNMYSLMTQSSIISLRHWMPEVKITLACDPETSESLISGHDPILKLADECVVVPVPAGSSLFRNRYLKTSVGTVIEGPFLFLDSDTLVRKNLSALIGVVKNADIAAAVNHSQPAIPDQQFGEHVEIIQRQNWQFPAGGFYNSGVVWYSGRPESKAFAAKWHQRWLVTFALGPHFDQPAFNATLADSVAAFVKLPGSYNAQIYCNPSCAATAAIWHYYASVSGYEVKHAYTAIERYLLNISPDQKINPRKIIGLTRLRHPWRFDYFFDHWVIRLISRTTQPLDDAMKYWLTGRRKAAVREHRRRLREVKKA